MPPSRVRVRVSGGSGRRGVLVVPLLLFSAILLVAGLAFNLAYLDTGGEQFPATPATGAGDASAQGLIDPQTATYLLMAAVAGFVISMLVLYYRRRGPKFKRVYRPTGWADVIATLLAFLVFAAIIYLWARLVPRGGTTSATNTTGGGGTGLTLPPAVGGIPLGVFLAGAVLASIVAIGFFFRVGSNLLSLRRTEPSFGGRRLAVRAVQAAISELQLGADVRGAILACYERFCLLLGARGIREQEVLTPREIEDLAVARLAVSSDSAEALTSLFEEARYSKHDLGDADRDRAVRSLETIRADLEG